MALFCERHADFGRATIQEFTRNRAGPKPGFFLEEYRKFRVLPLGENAARGAFSKSACRSRNMAAFGAARPGKLAARSAACFTRSEAVFLVKSENGASFSRNTAGLESQLSAKSASRTLLDTITQARARVIQAIFQRSDFFWQNCISTTPPLKITVTLQFVSICYPK